MFRINDGKRDIQTHIKADNCSACGMPSMMTGDTQQPSLKAWYEWGRGWQGRRRGNIEEVLKTKVRTIKETENGKKVRRGEEKKEGRKEEGGGRSLCPCPVMQPKIRHA